MIRIAIIFSGIFSISAHATDLLDLYERSLQHNTQYLQTNYDTKLADENLTQTRSSVLPDINFSARASETTIERYKSSGSFDPTNYDRDTYNLKISQPLLHIYVLDELDKSNNLIAQSRINQDESKTLLILESVRHYFNLIRYNNNNNISALKREYYYHKYSAAEKLYATGAITTQEFDKHRNEFKQSKIDLENSAHQLTQIKNEVYIFSGKELNDINDIKLISMKHNARDVQELVQTAMISNNKIKSAEKGVKIRRNEIRSQQAKHYPTVDLVAEYDYVDITQGGSQFGATTREDSSISLVLNFPIFNGGYQSSKTNEARLNYEKAQLDYKNSKRLIRKDIIDSANKYNLEKDIYKLAKDRMISNSKNFKNAELGRDKGIYTDTQYLEAKIQYLESETEAKNALMNYIFSELTIDYFLNQLDEEKLRKINSYLVW